MKKNNQEIDRIIEKALISLEVSTNTSLYFDRNQKIDCIFCNFERLNLRDSECHQFFLDKIKDINYSGDDKITLEIIKKITWNSAMISV